MYVPCSCGLGQNDIVFVLNSTLEPGSFQTRALRCLRRCLGDSAGVSGEGGGEARSRGIHRLRGPGSEHVARAAL